MPGSPELRNVTHIRTYVASSSTTTKKEKLYAAFEELSIMDFHGTSQTGLLAKCNTTNPVKSRSCSHHVLWLGIVNLVTLNEGQGVIKDQCKTQNARIRPRIVMV